jgi:hypothetical protein
VTRGQCTYPWGFIEKDLEYLGALPGERFGAAINMKIKIKK